jgi:hypothetical protein
MSPAFAPAEKSLVCDRDRLILCFHINTSSKIQIISLKNMPNLTWERIIFPGERLMFEALPDAQLEIKSNEVPNLLVFCQQIRVIQN